MCISDGSHTHSISACAGDSKVARVSIEAGRSTQAFSLVEMMAAVTLVLILAGLLAATLSQAQAKARLTGCVQHLHQLQLGWQMYVDDYGGALPGNTAVKTGGVWRGAVESWAGPHSAPADTNARNLELGQLWQGGAVRSAEVFRCPGDRSTVEGSRVLRSRSYSLNGNLGGRTNEQQACVWSQTEIQHPSTLMAFMDEHEDSIDDGHFLVWPEPDDRWVNLPSDRHGGVGTWTAVDGHVERRRWKGQKAFRRENQYWVQARLGGDLEDLRALQRWILVVTNYQRQP